MDHSRVGSVFVFGGTLLARFALAGVLGLAPGLTKADGCEGELRPLVEAKMKELGVPGVILDVEAPGQCRWTATLGTGDVEKPRPMQLDDSMRVGSVTKTFTGTAVLQLVDEGKVRLDDPISRYLPGVPNGGAVTVRQMMQMRSGLYNYTEDPGFNASLDKNPQRVWTGSELIAIGLAKPPYFAPGAGFHYSNTNTILLGRLVEVVTGNTLGRELRRRIFQPLGMTRTSLPDIADAAIPSPHPRGYRFGTNVGTLASACDAAKAGRRDVTDESPSWTWAAGGAISTLHDLKIWARALAKGTLLKPATQAERLRFIPMAPPAAPGYGLNIANLGGILGHDGALPGFQSFVGYVPGKDATIVVLANLYPDNTCELPANEVVKVIGGKLQLFRP